MTRLRQMAAIAGFAAVSIAAAELVGVRVIPASIDRAFVYVVGLVPLLVAVRVVQDRRRGRIKRATTPDPEIPVPTPSPGDSLEDALEQLTGTARRYRSARQRLREIAVDVLVGYEGYSTAEARQRIEDGAWTSDPEVASFLDEGVPSEPPLRTRLGAVASGEDHYERRVRKTIDAIAAYVDGVEIDAASSSSPLSWIRREIGANGTLPSLRRERTPTDRDVPTIDDASDGGDGGTHLLTRRTTGHWRGVSVVAWTSVGIGVLFGAPAVVLAGIAGIGYAAYTRASTLPEIELSVERTLDEPRPDPDEPVEVTLTIRNEGDGILPDLRIVDGVPPALSVREGSPRLGTTLRPGGTATVSYAIEARRGRHAFSPPLVLACDSANTVEHELLVEPREETTVTCLPTLESAGTTVPLRERATRYTGRLETSIGGEGIEFYATRAYRPGDPVRRIDWHRRARTGEFATLEFRQERAATVVILVDARREAYVSPAVGAEHAVDRSVDGSRRLVAGLLGEGHRVGVAALGATDCWLPPGAGSDHRAKLRTTLATHPALSWDPPGAVSNPGRQAYRLRRRFPSDAQLLVFSPLCDRKILRTVREFDAHGHPVTVVSPDPTTDRTPGNRLARAGRQLHVRDLRRADVTVIDWPWDDSLEATLASSTARWSR